MSTATAGASTSVNASANDAAAPVIVPEGFRLHTENTAKILLPSTNEAFLNPVQEFNRDTSVACIRVWSELLNQSKEAQWQKKMEKRKEKKRAKLDQSEDASAAPPEVKDSETTAHYHPHKINILEALSATGLRSIRYAQEIPLVKYVLANDLSESAVEAMKRNVELNGLGPSNEVSMDGKVKDDAKVRVNHGDACSLMYNHREEHQRVDVVDLDPYGTAAPFLDAAVQSVKDNGLLCVTCTDLAVLATNNYPEKCFSNYGGVSVKAEYCHESALRLVLHAISTSASRYGRYIEPLVSLSIDFYVRVFVRVRSAPIEVKKASTKTSMFYVCTGCQAHHEQPLVKFVENRGFKVNTAPTVPEKCTECESSFHVAGPMWSGPLHDPTFLSHVLEHVEANQDKYGTAARMKGMLTVAKEELNVPFYFTPGKVAGFFHAACPSMNDMASALLHAGYQVSRSHTTGGSIKTNATRAQLYDIFRSWVKLNPVKMENISEGSPARRLLAKEPTFEASFKYHPGVSALSSKVKLVRYQQNPTPHWGPGTKADAGIKRKRQQGDEE